MLVIKEPSLLMSVGCTSLSHQMTMTTTMMMLLTLLMMTLLMMMLLMMMKLLMLTLLLLFIQSLESSVKNFHKDLNEWEKGDDDLLLVDVDFAAASASE